MDETMVLSRNGRDRGMEESKIKWYEYYDFKTCERVWYTQRDKNGNCFEIRKLQIPACFRLFINDSVKKDYDTLAEAQQVVIAEWAN